MSEPTDPPRQPFDCELGAIPRFTIEVQFACGRDVYLPTRFLLTRYRPSTLLSQLLPRFRCQQCGARVGSAALIERADSQASGRGGAPLGWRIELEVRRR